VIVHILNQNVSPPAARVWTMHCGAQCFVFDDASTAPETDFVLADAADLSDCIPCHQAALPREWAKLRSLVR